MIKNTSRLLVAIDIGNSTTSYGFYRGGILIGQKHVSDNDIPKIAIKLKQSGVNLSNIRCIVSSVVPKNTQKLLKSLASILPRRSVYIVGKDVFPRFKSKYDEKMLGTDRSVNIYGAIKNYKLPVLIIDLGTAITFDYVGKSGIFEGGLIIPGIETSFRALEEKTALLPKIAKIGNVSKLTGRDTKSAMRSGILNGFGALADGLIERFKEEYGPMKVLATGGFSKQIARYAKKIDYVDPLHTIRSLVLIYQNEIEEKVK